MTFGAMAEPASLNRAFKLRSGANTARFNPTKDADLRTLQGEIGKWLQHSTAVNKHAERGLEEILRLAGEAMDSQNAQERAPIEQDLVETVLAVDNLERPTIPRHFDMIMIPAWLRQLSRPIGTGKKPATDLAAGAGIDLSRRDPLPSSFWSRPSNIATENLFVGFGRTSLPDVTNQICRYAEAKESSGMNPGYEVECNGERVKLKFGEQSTEPVVTRLFWALGFNADPTDYAPAVKVAYDRRIFTEFNSRAPVRTTFTALWFIPVYTMNLQPHKDPFDYVAAAVLRDGRRWSGAELQRHLMAGTNFLPAVEAQINYVITTPANVQVRDPRVKSIGPWDYAQLDHADRREIRGAGLLAAWLGFYDARFDNTKLRRVGSKKHPRLVHYFSDLGGGLGRTTGFLSWHGENVNQFPWTFTEAPSNRHAWRITGYTPIVRNAAFAAMTLDDARWMARLIGQLGVGQIEDALRASGYDAPTVQLYTEKLASRRNHMIADLGLSREFAPLAGETPLAYSSSNSNFPPAKR